MGLGDDSHGRQCRLTEELAQHVARRTAVKWRGSQSSFAQARVSILQCPFSRLLPDWYQQRAVSIIIDGPEFYICLGCPSSKHTAGINVTGTATKGICLHHLWPQVQPQVQSEPAQSGAHRRAQLRLRGVRTAICVATAPQEAPREARQGVLPDKVSAICWGHILRRALSCQLPWHLCKILKNSFCQ
nr:uncharacterized protein LOC126536516 [Dermacentor andersoni]